MKVIKLSSLFLLGALTVASCKKKKETVDNGNTTTNNNNGGGNQPAPDVTAPTITVLGQNPKTIAVGDPYTDAGAISIDDNGDTLTVATNTANVNTATAGSYQVEYTSTDAAGNQATASRTVNVTVQEKNWEGDWNVTHDVTTGGIFPTDLLKSPCNINGYAGFYTFDHGTGGNKITEGTVSGQNITMGPNDITVNISSTYTLEGTGSINSTGDQIVINYTITNCSGCLSQPSGGTATYDKQ